MNPQYISLAYADRLIEFKVDPSVSTVRDSSDNTLAEASGTDPPRLFRRAQVVSAPSGLRVRM